MSADVRTEIILALVLLGADPMLRASVASWREGMPETDLLADLRNWNEAKLLELKEWLPTMTEAELESVQERIRLYEELRREAEAAHTG